MSLLIILYSISSLVLLLSTLYDDDDTVPLLSILTVTNDH